MHHLRARVACFLSIVIFLLSAARADAHVTRIEVISRTDVLDGRTFGLAGAYERIVGRVYFAVNPDNLHNKLIVDLDKAPRNAQGEVEFSSDLYLLKPKDINKGNGSVLFEVSNRGGKGILHLVNGFRPATPEGEYGDGFLMREGYTVAWVGWEFDVPDEGDRLKLIAPVIHDAGGKEIRGLVRSDFTPARATR